MSSWWNDWYQISIEPRSGAPIRAPMPGYTKSKKNSPAQRSGHLARQHLHDRPADVVADDSRPAPTPRASRIATRSAAWSAAPNGAGRLVAVAEAAQIGRRSRCGGRRAAASPAPTSTRTQAIRAGGGAAARCRHARHGRAAPRASIVRCSMRSALASKLEQRNRMRQTSIAGLTDVSHCENDRLIAIISIQATYPPPPKRMYHSRYSGGMPRAGRPIRGRTASSWRLSRIDVIARHAAVGSRPRRNF